MSNRDLTRGSRDAAVMGTTAKVSAVTEEPRFIRIERGPDIMPRCPIDWTVLRGQQRTYCSGRCRLAAWRARKALDDYWSEVA